MNLLKLFTKKRTILSVFVFFFMTVCFSSSAQAFSTPSDATYQLQFEQAVYQTDEMNLQSYVYETMKATAGSVVTTIIGCLSCDQTSETSAGLLITTGNLIASIYSSPPASGTQYVAYLKNQLGIVQPAYAQQGIGYQAMEKLIPVWRAFRNISYLFFVLIFVILGFAIMFRVKISPQAVVSIQSVLPKAILALILITFSYAIVGFMIDLIYILIFLINRVFFQLLVDEGLMWDGLYNFLRENSPFGTTLPLLISSFGTHVIFAVIVPLVAFFILIFSAPPVGLIVGVILAVLVLFAFIRTVWTLIKAYAMIVIHLVFAPFQIMLGVLPGSGSIGSWFKNLLANILVFPVMLAMLYLGSYLILQGILGFLRPALEIANPFNDLMKTAIFIVAPPPLKIPLTGIVGTAIKFGELLPSLVGVFSAATLGWQIFSLFLLPLTGIFVILMIPKAADMIKAFITGEPFKYGTAIGRAEKFVVIGGIEAGYKRGAAGGGPWPSDSAQGAILRPVKEAMQKALGG